MSKTRMSKFAILGTGEGRRPLLQEIHIIAMIMCLFQAIRDVNTLAIIQNLTLNEPWGTQEWKLQISIATYPRASISSD